MIPYFSAHVIPLGPVQLQVWGLFVAIGIGAAVWLAGRTAERWGGEASVMHDLAAWFIVPAFVFARLVHVLVYDPSVYLTDPLAVLRVWEGGASSFGGFLGALIGGWAYFRVHKDVAVKMHAYVDAAAFSFPLGYAIGRIGCFLIHDHPGTLSDAWFAVDFPDGPRLDHGLLLAVTGGFLFGTFVVLRRYAAVGHRVFLPLLLGSYGAVRFILDFWRARDLPLSDPRFWGLAPSQYGALLLLAAGLALGYHVRKGFRNESESEG